MQRFSPPSSRLVTFFLLAPLLFGSKCRHEDEQVVVERRRRLRELALDDPARAREQRAEDVVVGRAALGAGVVRPRVAGAALAKRIDAAFAASLDRSAVGCQRPAA